jgi:hypothetical protein
MNIPRIVGAWLSLGVASGAHAVGTEAWKIQTAADFRAGKLERVIVSSEGEVTLGRRVSRAAVEGQQVWSLARDASGTIYAGTGPKGRVYSVKADAAGVPKAALVFETEELVITSMVIDTNGVLYAGTIPNGRVFKLEPQQTKPTELAKLDAKYVWGLALGDGGKLYAATGPKGALFEIDTKRGEKRVLYQSKEKNLWSITRAPDGHLLVGSAPKALLFKVAPATGQATVLYDFEGDEVRALAVHKGAVYAAVNASTLKPMGLSLPMPMMRKPSTPGATGANAPTPHPAPGGAATMGLLKPQKPPTSMGGLAPTGDGAIYRLSGAGRVEQLFKMPRGSFTAVGVDGDGNVYAGGGSEARVYRISPAREVSVVHDFEEKQVLALDVRATGAVVAGTGNGAAVYVGDERQAERGTFFSRVFDARFPTRWGSVSWRASGKVTLQSRSGHTDQPDDTWSPWTALTGGPDGPAKVQSPRARYVQLRVDFGDDPKAILRGLTAYYLQQNQRARLTQLSVDDGTGMTPPSMPGPFPTIPRKPPRPSALSMFSALRGAMSAMPMPGAMPFPPRMGASQPGTTGSPPISAPMTPSRIPVHQTVRRISWAVDNPDGDELVYWVWVREQSSSTWILLNPKEPLTGTQFMWNTESFPDGHYVVKVKVSDERANPLPLALTHERTSPPVLVDNRKPEIVGLAIDDKTLEVKAVARDSYSPIRRAQYSIDGGEWSVLHPEDDLYDDKEERLRFTIQPRPLPGAHTLTVRAYDSDGNVGSASIVFLVP